MQYYLWINSVMSDRRAPKAMSFEPSYAQQTQQTEPNKLHASRAHVFPSAVWHDTLINNQLL